jgi:hypothetical protein
MSQMVLLLGPPGVVCPVVERPWTFLLLNDPPPGRVTSVKVLVMCLYW